VGRNLRPIHDFEQLAGISITNGLGWNTFPALEIGIRLSYTVNAGATMRLLII
jgi:hypothetical protein